MMEGDARDLKLYTTTCLTFRLPGGGHSSNLWTVYPASDMPAKNKKKGRATKAGGASESRAAAAAAVVGGPPSTAAPPPRSDAAATDEEEDPPGALLHRLIAYVRSSPSRLQNP